MYRGRLWTMRQFAGFGTAEETNERFRYLLDHGQTGLSTAFDMPSLMGHDSDHPRIARRGRPRGRRDRHARRHGDALRRASTSATSRSSMTINAPAAMMLAFYVVAAEESGVPGGQARRHDPGRHPQGVHRPEGVVLPGRPGDAPARRHDGVVDAQHAALAPGLDLRLPHPRGRQRRPRRSSRSRSRTASPTSRSRSAARHRRRRLRAAPELLLQRADRLLRGDRQVPRRPPHLGARAARDLRREEPARRG